MDDPWDLDSIIGIQKEVPEVKVKDEVKEVVVKEEVKQDVKHQVRFLVLVYFR